MKAQMKTEITQWLLDEIKLPLQLDLPTTTLASGVKVPSFYGISLLHDGIKDRPITNFAELAEELNSYDCVVLPGMYGTGKTRTEFELLSVNWGFFMLSSVNKEGSEAFSHDH